MPEEEVEQLNLIFILGIGRYRLLAGRETDELTFVGGLHHSTHPMNAFYGSGTMIGACWGHKDEGTQSLLIKKESTPVPIIMWCDKHPSGYVCRGSGNTGIKAVNVCPAQN